MRFYLKGANKSAFFDFIQGDLESSLEKLNKRNEEDWQTYLDTDELGCKIKVYKVHFYNYFCI
jgi:hypothetical protein